MKAEVDMRHHEIVLIGETADEDELLQTWRAAPRVRIAVIPTDITEEGGHQRLLIGIVPEYTARGEGVTPAAADVDHQWGRVLSAEEQEEFHRQRLHKADGGLGGFAIRVGNLRLSEERTRDSHAVFIEAYRRWRKERDEQG